MGKKKDQSQADLPPPLPEWRPTSPELEFEAFHADETVKGENSTPHATNDPTKAWSLEVSTPDDKISGTSAWSKSSGTWGSKTGSGWQGPDLSLTPQNTQRDTTQTTSIGTSDSHWGTPSGNTGSNWDTSGNTGSNWDTSGNTGSNWGVAGNNGSNWNASGNTGSSGV